MPKKGYKQTKEHIENHRKTLKGKTYEEIVGIKKAKEWKKKQHKSLIKKWQEPKRKNEASERMKGNKSITKRLDVRKKLSIASIKRWQNLKERRKQGERIKGDKNPAKRPEVRKTISEKLKRYHKLNPGKGWLCRTTLTVWNKGLIGYNSGSEHWNWQGGISNEPYSFDFNRKLKESIRERDNYTCQLTGQYGKCVHHIDYNKKNSDHRNLITLSRSSNSKVNVNREYWQKYFEKYIRKVLKYGNVHIRSDKNLSQS